MGEGESELRGRFRRRIEETAEKAVEAVVPGETKKWCQGKRGLCKRYYSEWIIPCRCLCCIRLPHPHCGGKCSGHGRESAKKNRRPR